MKNYSKQYTVHKAISNISVWLNNNNPVKGPLTLTTWVSQNQKKLFPHSIFVGNVRYV